MGNKTIRSSLILTLCLWIYSRHKRRKKLAEFTAELPPGHISIKDDCAGAPKEEETETEQQYRETDSPQTTTQPLSEPLDTAAEVQQAGKSGKKSKKNKQRNHNINWLAWQTVTQGLLTLAMICVLIHHAILFSGQQQAMRDQSKLLAQSVEQTKALISQQQEIEQARIGVTLMELTKLAVGQLPTVTVTFFNGGRTGASQFKFTRAIYFRGEADRLSTTQRFNRKPVNSFGGWIMPPGGEKTVVFEGNFPVRKDQLAAMDAGQVRLSFEVYVHYVDGFGRDRVEPFCAVYNPDAEYKEFERCYE